MALMNVLLLIADNAQAIADREAINKRLGDRMGNRLIRKRVAIFLGATIICAGLSSAIAPGPLYAQEDALYVLIKSCKGNAQKCSPQRLQTLIDSGADPNYTVDERNGVTVLELAVVYGVSPDAIEVLVEAGASVQGNSHTLDALYDWAEKIHYGCSGEERLSKHWERIFDLLIAAGADPNAARYDGRTPLMVLAETRACLDAFQLLLSHGADVHARTEEGKTALDFARDHLEERQASVQRTDADWARAVAQEAKQVVAYLSELTEGDSGTTKNADGPPMPFVLQDVCPYEGCTYDRWIADTRISVYASEGDLANRVFEVRKNEIYTAVTGNVHAFRHHRIRVTEPVTLSVYAPLVEGPRELPTNGQITLEEGDELYVLAYLGEGLWAAWHDGGVYEFVRLQTHWTDWCGAQTSAPAECFETVWWVQVRDRSGRTGWIMRRSSSDSLLSYYENDRSSEFRWPTVQAASDFIEDRERILFQTPVYEDDWRAKAALILTFQWDEYEQAYGEALNNRTLAYETLQTAQRLLEEGELGAANHHLEMHLYYFDVMIARFKEIGRTLELSGETLQRYGQASTKVACLSTQMALISAGRPELKDVVSLLCIPVRFAVDVRLGEQFDDAAKDGATRVVTWAMWHWAANNAFNDWQEWEGWIEHTTRQGGSEFYQRLTENVTTEQMYREIMELATEAPDFILGETFSQVSEDEVQEIFGPVVEEMIEIVQSSAVGNAASGSPNRENP